MIVLAHLKALVIQQLESVPVNWNSLAATVLTVFLNQSQSQSQSQNQSQSQGQSPVWALIAPPDCN